MSLEDIAEKTSLFVKPQLLEIEKTYGETKYAVITWEAVAYAVSIACHISGRQIKSKEVSDLLLLVFGESYQPRFNHLGHIDDMSSFLDSMQDVYDVAKEDVKNGTDIKSNHMVDTAKIIYNQSCAPYSGL